MAHRRPSTLGPRRRGADGAPAAFRGGANDRSRRRGPRRGAADRPRRWRRAERRHRASFRTRFILTWAVILGAPCGSPVGLTVEIDLGFLAEWLPFILGGVWITLFISVSRSSSRSSWRSSGRSGGCRRTPTSTAPRRSTSRSSAGRRSSSRSCSSSWPCRRRASSSAAADRDHRPAFNYGAYLTEVFRAGIQAVPRRPGRGGAGARPDRSGP